MVNFFHFFFILGFKIKEKFTYFVCFAHALTKSEEVNYTNYLNYTLFFVEKLLIGDCLRRLSGHV